MWVVLKSKSTSWNVVERLIFPAPEASYTISSFPDELILIPREDGQKVPCLFLPFRHARFLIIYFHANAEDLGLCYAFCGIVRDLFQVHVLAVEYPGYGICGGKSDEAGIMANATAAFKFATETLNWPLDGIKIFGRSLGTGPAIRLATENEVAGLILVSPFASIRELFRSQVGPLADWVIERFPNGEIASKITSPVLIIHGQQDTLIPLQHGKDLYEIVPTRKMLVCPATMSHNTSLLKNVGTFVLPMTQFFSLPDYTFEDITVPAWAFPTSAEYGLDKVRGQQAAATTPRPRSGLMCQAADSQTSPAGFPNPNVGDDKEGLTPEGVEMLFPSQPLSERQPLSARSSNGASGSRTGAPSSSKGRGKGAAGGALRPPVAIPKLQLNGDEPKITFDGEGEPGFSPPPQPARDEAVAAPMTPRDANAEDSLTMKDDLEKPQPVPRQHPEPTPRATEREELEEEASGPCEGFTPRTAEARDSRSEERRRVRDEFQGFRQLDFPDQDGKCEELKPTVTQPVFRAKVEQAKETPAALPEEAKAVIDGARTPRESPDKTDEATEAPMEAGLAKEASVDCSEAQRRQGDQISAPLLELDEVGHRFRL